MVRPPSLALDSTARRGCGLSSKRRCGPRVIVSVKPLGMNA